MSVTLSTASTATASATGNPVSGSMTGTVSEDNELSVLLGKNTDDDSIRKEYQALEKSCQGLSVKDINTKAYPYYVKRHDMEKGMMLHRIAASRYNDKLSDIEKIYCAIAYGNIGYHLIFEQNNPLVAYPYLAKGLEIANRTKVPCKSPEHTIWVNTKVGINTNIAKIFTMYRDYSRAMHYYRLALDIAKKDNNPIAIPFSFTDLLYFVWTTDTLSSIRDEIINLKNTTIPNNSLQTMYDYAKLMAEAGEEYLDRRFDNASILVDSAFNKYDIQVDDRRYPVFNRIIAGKIAFANKDYTKAEEYFSNAERIIREEKLEDIHDLICQLYADLYDATGNKMLAGHYRNEGSRMRDSLYSLQSYGAIRDVELALLTREHEEKLSGSHSETRRWMYSTLFSCLTVLVVCMVIVYLMIGNRKLKKDRESLTIRNMESMEALEKPDNAADATSGETPSDDNTSEVAENSKTCQEQEFDWEMENSGQYEAVSEEDLDNTYRQILEYMANSDDIFQPAFTIDSLAAASGLKLKQVSQAINTVGGKNFNTLLGEFRVKKACEKIMDTYSNSSQRPTIEVLAEEVGYKSRTHFLRVFKSVTGLTTTEFVRQVKNKKR